MRKAPLRYLSHKNCNLVPCSADNIASNVASTDHGSEDIPTLVTTSVAANNCGNVNLFSNKLNMIPTHHGQDLSEVENMTNSSNQSIEMKQSRRIFNVVWGKKSLRKHKRWEGDGTLEVLDTTAVFKDSDGKVLGQISRLKPAQLEEGSRLLIANKEVEIIEEIFEKGGEGGNTNKNDEHQKCSIIPVAKKAKLCTTMQTIKGKFLSPVNDKNVKPLIMPRPDDIHQWYNNEDRKAVVDVELDLFLTRVLRPHQREGVTFLYCCINGYRNRDYYGAILADDMGLGKTLQCISLIWMVLNKGPYGGIPLVRRVLVVTPSSLVDNWQKEFRQWLGYLRMQPFVVNQKQKVEDYANLPASRSPVMIISYEMLIRHISNIEAVKFDLVICDEGHRLKNSNIRTSNLIDKLECKRRILITGTPIQNDLQEFFSLVDFVNPGILGSYGEFRSRYESVILASQLPNCTIEDQELAEERARELHECTHTFILRRTQDVIGQYLPPKEDIVLFCIPNKMQISLYKTIVAHWERSISDEDCDKQVTCRHLAVITSLRKICNHPILLKNQSKTMNTDDTELLELEETLLHTVQTALEQESLNKFHIKDSTKFEVINSLLTELCNTNEKIVIVSYFTQTLDLMELLCTENGYSFCRLDGSTPSSSRMKIVDDFNSPRSNVSVFLLSAKAGGVGLNLVGASRLVLFDSDWNPATDLQAMSRVWRDGQKKKTFIYRILMAGSIEEKMYQRQITKTELTQMALLDVSNTPYMRFSKEQLRDLFTLQTVEGCLTHDMLQCKCNQDGSSHLTRIKNVSTSDEDSDDEYRPCQLGVTQKSTNKKKQLLNWQHYGRPQFDDNLLQDLGLKNVACHISFIFRNTTN